MPAAAARLDKQGSFAVQEYFSVSRGLSLEHVSSVSLVALIVFTRSFKFDVDLVFPLHYLGTGRIYFYGGSTFESRHYFLLLTI
jgi:hypothetical protein